MCGVIVVIVATMNVNAETQTWQFTITGADMMNVVYADGATGDKPVDLGIYEGARLYRGVDPDPTAVNYARSYVEGTYNENGAFETWFTTTTNRLASFNLWGQDGRGEGWGEVFNSTDQNGISSPTGWTQWDTDWPSSWGTPPDDTSTFIGWDAAPYDDVNGWGDVDYDESIGFGDGNETNWDKSFTFDIGLDTDDWNWYSATEDPWHNGVEGQLCFWFGGWEVTTAGDWGSIYEGNVVLQGHLVPLPAAAWAGLVLLGGMGLKKRFG